MDRSYELRQLKIFRARPSFIVREAVHEGKEEAHMTYRKVTELLHNITTKLQRLSGHQTEA